MDDDWIHTNHFHQNNVSSEGLLEVIVCHGISAVLDHNGRPVEPLDIRQSLDENTRSFFMFSHGITSPGSIRLMAVWKVFLIRANASLLSASNRRVSTGLVFDARIKPQPSS